MGSGEAQVDALGRLIGVGIREHRAQMRLIVSLRAHNEDTATEQRLLIVLGDILDLMHDRQRHLIQRLQG